MEKDKTDIISEVAKYYSSKLAEHGPTPKGVDWNSGESQGIRFEQLTKVIDRPGNFSLNDLGCGYGALYDYLRTKYKDIYYTGCDISKHMIDAANSRITDKTNTKYLVSSTPPHIADYGIASGIFNVKLKRTDDEWCEYIKMTIDILDRTSRLGFSFNCLTSYSDPALMRRYLYYADPLPLFNHCKQKYSRNVALLHDYGLYEFTILVRKNK